VGRGAAFTLMEVILALALVALTAGVVLLSLPTFSRGQMLAQGAEDMETVIHMARADAANMGKRLRLEFQEDALGGTQPVLMIERYPLAQPGKFSPYTECLWLHYLDAVKATAVVVSCTVDESDMVVSDLAGMPGDTRDAESQLHWLTFYADGSSDTAVMDLASAADDGDPRVARIEIDGLSGKVDREVLTTSQLEESESR
jgi:hypothetical protein